MFNEFFLREVKSGLRQPMIYIFFLLFALIAGAAVASESIVIGGSVGNIHKNSPFFVGQIAAFMSLFGILIAAAFFNNAALRDFKYQFNEILFSTPLQKSGYFFGRFMGALVLSTIPICGIYIGTMVGSVLGPAAGWITAEQIGPTPFYAFITSYFLFVFPNILISGSIIFALASKFKNTIISFVGAISILIGYTISVSFASDIENETISAMVDMLGVGTYGIETKYFTPAEKNTIAPSFSGLLMWNRLLWSVLALLVVIGSYKLFSFKESKKVKGKLKEEKTEAISVGLNFPKFNQVFSFGSSVKVFLSFFKMNFLSIAKSNVFKILFIFNLILLIAELWGGFEYFGLKSYPVTYKMIEAIDDSSVIFMAICMVFFSGELIWRDKDVHIHEVINATPFAPLNSLFAKGLSLIVLMTVMYFVQILFAIFYQLANGFFDIEFGVYISYFILDKLPFYLTWSFIFIFIQVLINQKYIGYFVSILIFMFQGLIWGLLDIQSNMLRIGANPSISYSEMNGFGPGLTGSIWFGLYWVAFGFIALQLAAFIWMRGNSSGIKQRFNQLKAGLKGKTALIFSTSTLIWVGIAVFVFYNTQILNTYTTSDMLEQQSVDYEKKYKKYEHVVTPVITDVTFHIDLYPHEQNAFVTTDIIVKNKSEASIDSLHYTLSERWNQSVEIPNSELVFNDSILGYQIFKLDNPLRPGKTLAIKAKAKVEREGFENSRGRTDVIQNGTFFNSMSVIPTFGYSSSYELSGKHDRKKNDLPKKDRMPALTANCTDACHSNYLTNGMADWVNCETYISTSSDQVAIAPGSLLEEKEENGRRFYHYKVDHKAQNFFSFISAEYEITRKKWNGIDIEIYHDEKHDVNVDNMIEAVERSLKYYTEHFGPYFHKQARIIEFPRYQTFAQAFPGTMPYSEAFGFIVNLEDSTKNNVVNAVIAHEMAHQWWAHQEVSAYMQGGTMLTESFSEYSSLMVMKQQNNKLKMKEYIKYDLNRYLRGRSTEREKEVPLLKVENQGYVHYGKGSVILYALQDYIGEDSVNAALRDFLAEFRYQEPPYPTSNDFIRHLRPKVPDTLQYLIKDWFEEITLYDNRVKLAEYNKIGDSQYKIKVDLESHKIKADSLGNELKLIPNDWIDVGIYADKDQKELIMTKRLRFDTKSPTFEFIVDQEPKQVAVDPYKILIERVYKDNVKTIDAIEE